MGKTKEAGGKRGEPRILYIKEGVDVGEHWSIVLVGIGAGFLQAIIIFVLMSIKKDIADIWSRIYDHYHEVECDSENCKTLKTGNVIIPARHG